MSKNIFHLALCALLLALGVPAQAQQSEKVFRIGYLSAQADRPGSRGGARELVRWDLHALGYVEAKNIVFEYRFADNKLDRLSSLADELVHLKVDLLLTTSNVAALAAKNATKTVPIVFLGSGDPVALGLVDSLARPGGEHYRNHQHCRGIGRQTIRDTQRNPSQALSRCRTVESTRSRVCATVERKPNGCARTRPAAAFNGSDQLRKTRERVQ